MKKSIYGMFFLHTILIGDNASTGEGYEPGLIITGLHETPGEPWRLAFFCGIIAIALYSLHRRRINQILRQQSIRRDRIARDLHDDIGSTLSNINMLSAIALTKLDKPEEAIRSLKRISEEVGNCSQALDDIIWSANSRNDTLDETIARMRRYCAELFEISGNTACHLDMDEQFTTRKLCMEQRRDIYLIYKEALNNIYKHASATSAWIRVAIKDQMLELMFSDDGKGFDATKCSHRNGLKNMRSRVEKWSGRISIVSNQGEGTRLSIVLPVSHPNG